MPEAFSPQCLTRVNLANAKHVMVSTRHFFANFLFLLLSPNRLLNFSLAIFHQAEAEKEGLVDAYFLNEILRVHTNSGQIKPALRFYDTEYKKHGMVSV